MASASIRTRSGPRGTTYAVLFRDPDTGRQTSRTFATERAAQDHVALIKQVGHAAAGRVLHARTTGVSPDLAPTLTATVLDHIERLEGVQPDTRKTYRTIAGQLDDGGIGAMPIDVLARADISAWTERLAAGGASEKTIRNKHALVSAALARAVDDGIVSRNVAARVRIARQVRPAMTFLVPEEFKVILDRATPHYRPLLMWLYGTGMRFGEATAIQIGDLRLDHEPPTVTVVRAWKHGLDEPGPPKTRAGERTISLPAPLVAAVRPLLEGRKQDDLLFVNTKGRRVLQASFHDLWQEWIRDQAWDPKRRKYVKRGAPLLGKTPRIHDLRHSHASWLIGQGLSLFDIKQRLGHESIQTTADTYGHLLPEAMVQAERAAALAFGPPQPRQIGA